MGGGLLADGLGMGRTMDEKMPKIFTSLILLTGMLVAVFFRGNVIANSIKMLKMDILRVATVKCDSRKVLVISIFNNMDSFMLSGYLKNL